MTSRPRNLAAKPAPPAPPPTAPGGRRARKSQKTIDHIGTTAWALFEAHGFDNVTMEAIAEAADVAKGTLYKYFPLKEALIRHRFEKDRLATKDEIAAAVLAKPTCAERLTAYFQIEAAYLDPMRSYLGAYVRYLLRSGITEQEHGDREIELFIAALLRQGQAGGEIGCGIAPESMAAHLLIMRSGTLMRWLNRPDGTLAAMLEEMLRLFFDGALPRRRS